MHDLKSDASAGPVGQTPSPAPAGRWRRHTRPVAEEPDDERLGLWEDAGRERWGDAWGGLLFEAPGGLSIWTADARAPAEVIAWAVALAGGEPGQWVVGPAEASDDWIARFRAAFQPIEAGGFRIVPPWLAPERVGPTDRVLVIDPTLAFGTGHHETTRVMLRLMAAEAARRGGAGWRGLRVLDVGSGSAILALAALKLGALAPVGATEIDPTNEANARANLVASGLAAGALDYRVTATLEGFGAGAFDLVLCNMLRERFEPLLAGMARVLAPGGTLLLSGYLAAEREMVAGALDRGGWTAPEAESGEGDWRGGVVRRRAG